MTGSLIPRSDLSPADRDAMLALFDAHFEGVTRDQFDADLADKNHAILLRRPDGSLAGFSTLLVYETTFDSAPVSVVYSGDTLVAPDAWGTPVLSRTWIASVNALRHRYPRGPYYWLLIVSGYRTYRFLPVFWRTFYPRATTPIPPDSARLLAHLASERFGPCYNPATNIVRFPKPQILRPHLRGIPPERLADPDVAHFAKLNPGHEHGDELVCLAELSSDNLTPAGRRMAGPTQCT